VPLIYQKHFDKINHNVLFLKLSKRRVPNEFLNMLVSWLSACYVCVKWLDVLTDMFRVNFGVRQGSVLSPFLFALYVVDLVKSCDRARRPNVFIILYADDILLLCLNFTTFLKYVNES